MSIDLIDPLTNSPLTESEDGLFHNGTCVYPNLKGSYRIVKDEDYSENFGFQWNRFAETQIDKSTNLDISYKRFFSETAWDPSKMEGDKVLEVGSGAGRFTQIILDHTRAELWSVDYSSAVEANFRNNGPNPRLHLFQASIYEMPFAKHQFDKVFCLGVLQHTPDPERSVQCLCEMVKPGGELVVDFYPRKGWWTVLHAKYFLRPFTKKMNHQKLFRRIDRNVDWMIKTTRVFKKLHLGVLNRFIPICDIDGTFPSDLPYDQLRTLCVLDTFDMFSPSYDTPQRLKDVIKWFGKYGMEKVWGGVIKYDNSEATVVRGIKK